MGPLFPALQSMIAGEEELHNYVSPPSRSSSSTKAEKEFGGNVLGSGGKMEEVYG